MKKLISILLALVFVFSMATVAMATGADETPAALEASTREDSLASESTTFYFLKEYTGTGATAGVFPAENLTFTVTGNDVEHAPTVSVATNQTIDSNPDKLAITVGALTGDDLVAGTYYYTINEVSGSTQGVSYTGANTEIKVTVWVFWEETKNDDGEVTARTLKKAVTFTKPDTGDKVDKIENQYDVCDLTVTKKVSGSLASTTQKFDITVKFELEDGKKAASNISWTVGGTKQTDITADQLNADGGYTASFSIADGSSVVFNNVPKGVSYTITEDAKHILAEGATMNPNDSSSGYTATYNADKTQLNETKTETILNVKDNEVDTGISLDSVPFILILAVCAGAAIVFVTKRRSVEF